MFNGCLISNQIRNPSFYTITANNDDHHHHLHIYLYIYYSLGSMDMTEYRHGW